MNDMKKPARWWRAPCGLNCDPCPIRRRAKEELDYWREQNVDPDQIRCDGCRSDRSGHHWSPDCKVLQCCVYERKLEFCAPCPDFPCPLLEEWGKINEYHARAVQNLARMRERGVEKWLAEQNPRTGKED